MIKISPAVQLSLGLVFLTISIIILAQGLGLSPSQDEKNIYARQKLSENIALQTTLAIKRDDQFLLRSLFESTVAQTDSILSIGLRKVDGSVVYQSQSHQNQWKSSLDRGSNSTHIRIPILIDGSKKADLEISYNTLAKAASGFFGLPKFAWLIIFIAVSGFVCFWFYIKRVLHHLDPSSVVPARVKNALNIMTEGVVILDKKGQVILVNDSLLTKVGMTEKQITWKKLSELPWSTDNNTSLDRLPWLLAQHDDRAQTDVRLMFNLPTGKNLIFKVNSVPILDEKNNSQGTMTSFNDVTEIETKSRQLRRTLTELVKNQKLIEEKNQKLHYLASRDPLTDSLNRRSLFNSLNSFFASKNRDKIGYCVIMMDIDHFKKVNDVYGHSVGDSVIKSVCNDSTSVVGTRGELARFGGEEFCILLPGASLNQAQNIAEACRAKVQDTIVDGVRVTISLGVSSIQFGASSPQEIIQQADEALYLSKESGRNQYSTWTPGLSQDTREAS